METKTLTLEQTQDLLAPLSKDALKQHPTKKFLTTINPAYVIERMNDVFGVGTWTQKTIVLENTAQMVVVQSTLTVPAYGIEIETFGGNDNPDKGDAYKGAQTDAFTKACSMLGIGLHIWKNEKTQGTPPSPMRTVLGEAVGKVCPSCSVEMKLIPAGTSKATGKDYPAFYACPDCKTKIASNPQT